MNKKITTSLLSITVFLAALGVTIMGLLYLSSPVPRVQKILFDNSETPRFDVIEHPAPTSEPPIHILAVGDIMLGRNVEVKMAGFGEQYPFEKISDFLRSFDSTFANLEGPIVTNPIRTPTGSTRFSFPSSRVRLLKDNGIDVVSIANNHTFDFGTKGYEETTQYLTEGGIAFSGHPTEIGDRYVTIREIGKEKIVVISFHTLPQTFDETKAVELVRRYVNDSSNFIFVSIHWGAEYIPVAEQKKVTLAHALIDAGADVIIGHHPHVVQNIELYQGKLIFYSLGNFIFDQYFSQETQEGLAVELAIDESRIVYRLYPIDIVQSQPTLMEKEKAGLWLSELASRSSPEIEEEVANSALTLHNSLGANELFPAL